MADPVKKIKTGEIFIKKALLIFFALIFLTAFTVSCQEKTDTDNATPAAEETEVTEEIPEMNISSSAFKEGEEIPSKYTGDGEDISPHLEWSEVPEGTESFALICDDPDAPSGTWVHCIIFNMSPDTGELLEGITEDNLPKEALFGKNSWGETSYNGPSPPPGKAHRYFFKIYALDTILKIEKGADKKTLEEAMEGHILAEGKLMGLYGREPE